MSLKDIRHKKYAIQINDATYYLQYDYNAFAELEELTGKTRKQLYDGLYAETLSSEDEMKLVYCGLLRHHPDIDMKTVGQIENTAEISQAVVAAFLEAQLPPEIFNHIFTEKKKKMWTAIFLPLRKIFQLR